MPHIERKVNSSGDEYWCIIDGDKLYPFYNQQAAEWALARWGKYPMSSVNDESEIDWM